jgi:hypothetical protein
VLPADALARPYFKDKQPREGFMRKSAYRTLASTVTLTLVASATALASGALSGKTYVGRVSSSGIRKESGHRVALRAGGNIVLSVARSGRSVTVRFSSSSPVLYCLTTKTLKVQTTRPASISGSGSFTASVSERFQAGPGLAPIVQVVSGRFSGRSVSGTIKTQAAECSGSTSFSAREG